MKNNFSAEEDNKFLGFTPPTDDEWMNFRAAMLELAKRKDAEQRRIRRAHILGFYHWMAWAMYAGFVIGKFVAS